MVERGTDARGDGRRRCTALGHKVSRVAPGFKANAVERVGGRWVGAADPRSEGVAVQRG